jgi:hypothetical protein
MFLELLVILLPTIFALSIEVVSKEMKERPYYRIGIIGFGILLSGLTWLQIYRAHKQAAKEQEIAIEETSERVSSKVSESVSRSVTKSVSEQYTETINSLQSKIGSLESQLATQGKNVELIKSSNIVTGKQPIQVELANPGSLPVGESPLDIHASEMQATPNPQFGKHARQIIVTTNKVMNGGKALVTCKNKINRGEVWISGSDMRMGGGGMQDENTFLSGITVPNWSPSSPLVITLYFDEDDLGACKVTPLF